MCEGPDLFFKCILPAAGHIDSEGHTLRLHSIAEYGPMYGEDSLTLVP